MKIRWALTLIVLYGMLPASLFSQTNIDSLHRIITYSHDEKKRMTAYNDYAYQLYRTKPDSAIFYGNKALTLSSQFNDEDEINSAYNVIGLACHSKGLYRLSLANLTRSLQYDKKDTADRAKILHNIALTHRAMKNNSDALRYELEAIKLLQFNKDSLTLGVIYETICTIYRDMGDYQLSEEYIAKAIAIMESLKNFGQNNGKSFVANAYVTYGNLLQVSGNLSGAVAKHKQSIQLHKESGDIYNQAISYENLATDYALLKRYNEAISNYTVAKRLMNTINSGTDVGFELYNIAHVFQLTGNMGKAIFYVDSALLFFDANGADAFKLDAYKLKYEVYDSLKNTTAALQFYKQYNTLKDSLNLEAQKEETLRLKTDYETAQKEQQIKLLTTSNALQEKRKSAPGAASQYSYRRHRCFAGSRLAPPQPV